MRITVWHLAALALAACPEPQMPPKPPGPPQVFIIAPETNVIGQSVKVTVNVSGCTKVEQIQITQDQVTVKSAPYNGSNTVVELKAGDIARLYGQLGIAADLTLAAKAICDDGRTNTSPPVGVKFFPVASVAEKGDGNLMLPDSFVAEGGVSGTPVTFVGCAVISGTGNALVRVNLSGEVVGINPTLPFACDYYASISEKVAGGLRWLFQPGRGAFAFDQDLNVTGGVFGDSYTVFQAAPDGDAVIWDNMIAGTSPAFSKIRRNGGLNYPANTAWYSMVPGIVNGQPVIDMSSGTVYVPSWRAALGAHSGIVTLQQVSYFAGNAPSELQLLTVEYAFLDVMKPLNVAISPDARTVYIPIPDSMTMNQSVVLACGTSGTAAGCTTRWRSPVLPGIVQYVIPFAQGTKIAAITENKIWFLNECSSPCQGGQVLNPSQVPTATSGQLIFTGVQPGLGADFYVLAAAGGFATEIIAFDTPDNGEVWRYSFEGGGTAQSGITMAIDDSGAAWLRVGLKQVKPLSLSEYRNARGPTVPMP